MKLDKRIKIYFVCNGEVCKKLKSKLNISDRFIIHEWNELTEESQARLREKELKFQTTSVKFCKLLSCQNVPDKVFTVLCSNNEININESNKNIPYDTYIERKIIKIHRREKPRKSEESSLPTLMENSIEIEEFSVENFCEHIKNNQVVLLSDNAGSGKSTVLLKIGDILLQEFPQFWISIVSLKDHVKELSDKNIQNILSENFSEAMVKILKINPLEALIFKEKFSRSEVKLLLDGIDEISPNCKEECINLLKAFKAQNKNQIYVTTRSHLEQEIIKELDIEAFALKTLDRKEQIEFLRKIWRDSHKSQKVVKKCAEELVNTVSKMLLSNPNIIGAPLVIEGLGKLYVNEINKNFTENIKNLKISNVYDKIAIKASIDVFYTKFPEVSKEHFVKSESIIKVHYFLAVAYFFDETFASKLGLGYNSDEWSMEDIGKGGLVSYIQGKQIKFNHETHAESLLSSATFSFIDNLKTPQQPHIVLLNDILCEKKYQITRLFLHEKFEDYQKDNLEKYFSKPKITETFTKDIEKSSLRRLIREGLYVFVLLILKNIQENDVKKYKEILESDYNGKFLFVEIFLIIKKPKIFSAFLSEIFAFYGDKIIHDFLLKTDDEENSIIYHLTSCDDNEDILELFWTKILTHGFNRKELFEIMFHTSEKNLLGIWGKINIKREKGSIMTLKKLEIILKVVKSCLNEEQIKMLIKHRDSNCGNILIYTTEMTNEAFKYLYNFIEKIMDEKELKAMFQETEKRDLNVFQVFSFLANTTKINFLWDKICGVFEKSKEYFFKPSSVFNKNALHLSLIANPKEFPCLLNIAQKYRDGLALEHLITQEDKNLNQESLLILAIKHAPKYVIKILIEKIPNKFTQEEVINTLISLKGKNLENILGLVTFNKHLDAIEFIWQLIEKNFNAKEISELLRVVNKEGNNFYHQAVKNTKSRNILEFFWSKIENNINDRKEYFMRRGNMKNNIFLSAITNENISVINYVFKQVELFCPVKLDLRSFVLEQNSHGENLLEIAAKCGKENVEFAVNKISQIFTKSKIKELLTTINKNLLSKIVTTIDDLPTIAFLYNVYDDNLSNQEIIDIFSKNDENNFLIAAAKYAKSWEIAIFLYIQTSDFKKNRKEDDPLIIPLYIIHMFLHITIANKHNSKLFPRIFEAILKNHKKVDEIEHLILGKNEKDESLISLAVQNATKSNLEYLLNTIPLLLKSHSLRSIVNITRAKGGRNLLSIASDNENDDAIDYFWSVIEKNFNKAEIFELLVENNEQGKNILHFLPKHKNAEERFKLIWNKIESYFDDKEVLKRYFNYESILTTSIKNGNDKLYSYIFEDIICKIFDLRSFIQECKNGENFIHFLVREGSITMLKLTFEKVEENLTNDEFKQLLKSETVNKQTLLYSAIFSISKTAALSYLFQLFDKVLTKEEISEILHRSDSKGNNILHHATLNANSKEIIEFLWMKVSESENAKDLFKQKNFNGENILELSVRNKNCSGISCFVFNETQKVCDSKEEMRKMLLEENHAGENLLTSAVSFASPSNLKCLFNSILIHFGKDELKRLLNVKVEGKLNLICKVFMDNDNFNCFMTVWKFFQKIFNKDEILQLLHEQNEIGDYILHCNVRKLHMKNNFKRLWRKIKFTLNMIGSPDKNKSKDEIRKYLNLKGSYGRNVLLSSICVPNEKIFFFLFKIFRRLFNFEEILDEKDEDGNSFLHLIVSFGTRKMLEIGLKEFKSKVSKEKIESILMVTNTKDKNILHCAAKVKDSEISKIIFKFIHENMGNYNIKLMLEQVDLFNKNPLQITAKPNMLKVFKVFIEVYEEHLSKAKIKRILSKVDVSKFKIIDSELIDKINFYVKKYEKIICMTEEEIKEILSVKDENGNNFLHNAIIGNGASFLTIWTNISDNIERDNINCYISSQNNSGENILMTSIRSKSEFLFNFIFEKIFVKYLTIKEIIQHVDFDGENLLHYLARYGSFRMIELVYRKLQLNLDHKELRELLVYKSEKYRFNILHCAALSNQDEMAVRTLSYILKELFYKYQIEEMFKENDPIMLARMYNTPEIYKIFRNFTEDIDEIFENAYREYLSRPEDHPYETLHVILNDPDEERAEKIFDQTWNKICNLVSSERNKFVRVRNCIQENLIHTAIRNHKEKMFKLIFRDIYSKLFEFTSFINECTAYGLNFLQYLAQYGTISMLEFGFEQLEGNLTHTDYKNFIKFINKIDQCNILHYCPLNQIEDSIIFTFDKIHDDVDKNALRFLMNGDSKVIYLPIHAAIKSKSKNIFEIFVSYYERNFSNVEIRDMLDNPWVINLLNKNDGMFETVDEYIKRKTNASFSDLQKEKLLGCLDGTDLDGNNLVHQALLQNHSKSKDINPLFNGENEDMFIRLWDIISQNLDFDRQMELILARNYNGENILLSMIRLKLLKTFFCFFEKIIFKHFKLQDLIYETELNGENIMHYVARYGTYPMIEFIFENLEIILSSEELKNLMMIRNDYQLNILDCASIVRALKLLLEKIENMFTATEVREFLIEKRSLIFANAFKTPEACLIISDFNYRHLIKSEMEAYSRSVTFN